MKTVIATTPRAARSGWTARGAWLVAALALAVAATTGATPAVAALVQGRVVDKAGKPVEYANVSVPARQAGAVTDTDGRFTLDLPAGPATIEVAQIGYQRARLEVTVADGIAPLRVVLAEEPVPVAEVVVAASSFGRSGKSEGAVLRRLDVVTTPGGAADLFQALRALPGINAPAEGAALYVRGGDPSETMIRLDGGEIGHPYHYEGASGGLFSAFDAYMLKSAFFSSGGFASKYGGALSGVLDIETADPMGLRTVSVGANVVGGGVSTSWSLVPDKLSFIGTMRYSTTELLHRLYGSPRQYVSVPSSRDGAGRLIWRYSPTGRISALYLGAGDDVGVVTNRLNFSGSYARAAHNHFGAIQFQDAIAGRLALKGQVSGQLFDSGWSYGPIGLDENERNFQANLDGVWSVSQRHELSLGAIVRRPDDEIAGRSIADSTDYQSGAPTRAYGTHARLWAPGFYLEDKLRLVGSVYATVGGRLDYASVPGVWTADPRAALAWRVDDHQTARVAAGRYHQLADPRYLDPVYGNPALEPMYADHWIAGYEWRSSDANVRIETYRKNYGNLVTNDPATFYANGGHGYAQGADFFVQGVRRKVAGWISYGYLDSRRMELDDSREVPSSYGVRHSITVVGQYHLTPFWQFGGRFSHASGRPYTPVIGRSFDAGRELWRPVYGENNSDQLPDYRRLDLRLTRLFSLPAALGLRASNVCVLYVETMNVLGTENVLEYSYNDDYSARIKELSYFSKRMAVAGFALSW